MLRAYSCPETRISLPRDTDLPAQRHGSPCPETRISLPRDTDLPGIPAQRHGLAVKSCPETRIAGMISRASGGVWGVGNRPVDCYKHRAHWHLNQFLPRDTDRRSASEGRILRSPRGHRKCGDRLDLGRSCPETRIEAVPDGRDVDGPGRGRGPARRRRPRPRPAHTALKRPPGDCHLAGGTSSRDRIQNGPQWGASRREQ
jgi:hypothetical protein